MLNLPTPKIVHDKLGIGIRKDVVHEIAAKVILNQTYIYPKVKEIMETDLKKAAQALDDGHALFTRSIDKFLSSEAQISDSVKKVSGSVRDSTHKLAAALLNVEKTANFDRLEWYASTLERAADALERLAALEKAGMLKKISSALS